MRRRFSFPHFLQLSVPTAGTRDLESKRRGRKKLGGQHPDTLTSVNNLAALLKAQGRLEEAEPLFREAVEGSREAQLRAAASMWESAEVNCVCCVFYYYLIYYYYYYFIFLIFSALTLLEPSLERTMLVTEHVLLVFY